MLAPLQQGWVWNGSSWVWDPDCGECWPQPPVCNFPPPAPLPPPPMTGPIIGVVDGSAAAPGQVGEFLDSRTDFTFAALATSTQSISALIVQPGDWDMWAAMVYTPAISGVSFGLSPQPPGASSDMQAAVSVPGGTIALFLIGQPARGSFTAPTLLPFAVTFTQTGTPVAGTASLHVSCRRRR